MIDKRIWLVIFIFLERKLCVGWYIVNLHNWVESFSECTISIHMFGDDFDLGPSKVPLIFTRSASRDAVPQRPVTKIHHRSRCIAIFLVLRPEESYYKKLEKQRKFYEFKEKRLGSFGLKPSFLTEPSYVVGIKNKKIFLPHYLFILTSHWNHLIPAIYSIKIHAVGWFALIMRPNPGTFNLVLAEAHHICHACVASPKKGSLHASVKINIPLSHGNLRHALEKVVGNGKATIFAAPYFLQLYKDSQNNPTYFNCLHRNLIPHFFSHFECTASSSINRIYERIISSTLFRTMGYNISGHNEPYSRLRAKVEKPTIEYVAGNQWEDESSSATFSGVKYLVSSRQFNFITCFGSKKAVSFHLYLKPFSPSVWIGIFISAGLLALICPLFAWNYKGTNGMKLTFLEAFQVSLVLVLATLIEQVPTSEKMLESLNSWRLIMLWMFMGTTLTSTYQSIIVSDLTRLPVMINPVLSYWNLTEFKLYTPGETAVQSCTNNPKLRAQTDLYRAIVQETNHFHNLDKQIELRSLILMYNQTFHCSVDSYEALAEFQKDSADCRNEKIAFVHTSNMVLARNQLNSGLSGEPYKLREEPWLQVPLYWYFSNSAGKWILQKMTQLTNTGIDKFWREMETFLDAGRYRVVSRESASYWKSLKLDGNIITPFYIMLGGVGIALVGFLVEFHAFGNGPDSKFK